MTNEKCYWRKHLTGASYAVYDLLRAIIEGRKMSEIQISIRAISGMLAYHVPAVAEALDRLEREGWIQRYPGRHGRREATTYTIIDHEEWVMSHPGDAIETCRVPRQDRTKRG